MRTLGENRLCVIAIEGKGSSENEEISQLLYLSNSTGDNKLYWEQFMYTCIILYQNIEKASVHSEKCVGMWESRHTPVQLWPKWNTLTTRWLGVLGCIFIGTFCELDCFILSNITNVLCIFNGNHIISKFSKFSILLLSIITVIVTKYRGFTNSQLF